MTFYSQSEQKEIKVTFARLLLVILFRYFPTYNYKYKVIWSMNDERWLIHCTMYKWLWNRCQIPHLLIPNTFNCKTYDERNENFSSLFLIYIFFINICISISSERIVSSPRIIKYGCMPLRNEWNPQNKTEGAEN